MLDELYCTATDGHRGSLGIRLLDLRHEQVQARMDHIQRRSKSEKLMNVWRTRQQVLAVPDLVRDMTDEYLLQLQRVFLGHDQVSNDTAS